MLPPSARKPFGIYLNQPKAQCSIYESGQMVYEALRTSDRYTLEYYTLDPSTASGVPGADFYLFNYHHATMAWLNTASLSQLPGKKITVVLEMLPGNPFVYISPDAFDAYLVLDPTMNLENRKVYGFPRPLEQASTIPPYIEKDIPWIGSFGFGTAGKGFELVVDAVNREFDRALVRINIPAATFADDHAFRLYNQNYADYLTKLIRQVAKPGIEVQVTRDFMSRQQLLEWCSQNTLNCFLYSRNQPGLSATTDQCISVGRPLAVSANETFRHIHQYIPPYPYRSLRESIERSVEDVLRMREDWTAEKFRLRFESILADMQLLERDASAQQWFVPPPPKKEAVLWVASTRSNVSTKYTAETFSRVAHKSKSCSSLFLQCEEADDLLHAAAVHRPQAIFVAHDPDHQHWITREVLSSLSCSVFAFVHDGTVFDREQIAANGYTDVVIISSRLECSTRLPQVLPLHCNEQPIQPCPTICIHCYGPDYSEVEKLVSQAESEFEQGHILVNAPLGSEETSSSVAAGELLRRLQTAPRRPGFSVTCINRPYALDEQFTFMSFPSMHVFSKLEPNDIVYLDYALGAQRPVAIASGRALEVLEPAARKALDFTGRTFAGLQEDGISPLVPIYNDWSEPRFFAALAGLLAPASERKRAFHSSAAAPLNRVLDQQARGDYLAAIEQLREHTAAMMDSLQPEKIVVEAFTLDAIDRFATKKAVPRVLGIGTSGNAAAKTLKALGWRIEEVDPEINFDLDFFYALPTTVYGSYDVIFAPDALPAAEDEEMFLAQIGDLLAPGGVAILACPLADGQSANNPARLGTYTESDFRSRFLPILQSCNWADNPRWTLPQADSNSRFASLVIQKVSGAQ